MKVLTALAVALSIVAAQDRTTAPRVEPRPCDVSRVENRDWCPNCQVFLDPTEIERGKHEVCRTAVEPMRACVKIAFPCDQHGATRVWHARRCCPINRKDCCQPTTVLSKVEYRCDTCLQRGRTPDDVVHTNTRHSGPIAMTCRKSGAYPHGGESTPAFGEVLSPR